MEPMTQDRVTYLDGLRGIAIFLVFLFHVFARWPGIVPYGADYADFPLAKYGWLGVQLFFMISGFVIVMTLEKCASLGQFLSRRWLRLFPGMLLISFFVFASAGALSHRPSGVPHWGDLIPGLLFLEPSWIFRATGLQLGTLDGAFWSLFVEVKFYFFAGGLFFLLGHRGVLFGLGAAFGLSLATSLVGQFFHPGFLPSVAAVLDGGLGFQNFGWFLIGALAYGLHKKRSPGGLVLCGLVSLVTAAASGVGRHNLTAVVSLALILVFLTALYSPTLRWVLSVRPLVFLGFVSYPFYLLHQNLSVAILAMVGTRLQPLPGYLLPLVPFVVVVFVSYLVARWGEPWLRKGLRRLGHVVWHPKDQ